MLISIDLHQYALRRWERPTAVQEPDQHPIAVDAHNHAGHAVWAGHEVAQTHRPPPF